MSLSLAPYSIIRYEVIQMVQYPETPEPDPTLYLPQRSALGFGGILARSRTSFSLCVTFLRGWEHMGDKRDTRGDPHLGARLELIPLCQRAHVWSYISGRSQAWLIYYTTSGI